MAAGGFVTTHPLGTMSEPTAAQISTSLITSAWILRELCGILARDDIRVTNDATDIRGFCVHAEHARDIALGLSRLALFRLSARGDDASIGHQLVAISAQLDSSRSHALAALSYDAVVGLGEDVSAHRGFACSDAKRALAAANRVLALLVTPATP